MGSALIPALALTSALGAFATHADTVLFDSLGFESPVYSLGNLAGQNGWTFYGNGTAVVQSLNLQGGNRALALSESRLLGSGVYQTLGYAPAFGEIIRITAGALPGTSLLMTNNLAFSLSAFGPSDWIGDVGIVKSNGVLYGVATAAYGNSIRNYILASDLSPDTWHNLRMDIQVDSQTFNFYLDNILVGSDLPFIRPSSSINFTSLDVATYFTGVLAGDFPDFGIGYFDNYKVVSITVPEPNATFSTAIGTVVLLAFRCSKARRNRLPPS